MGSAILSVLFASSLNSSTPLVPVSRMTGRPVRMVLGTSA
jgi:hypothetical protein